MSGSMVTKNPGSFTGLVLQIGKATDIGLRWRIDGLVDEMGRLELGVTQHRMGSRTVCSMN